MLRATSLVAAGFATILASAAPAEAKHRSVRCQIKDGVTVARQGEKRVISREGVEEDPYGPPTSVWACRRKDRRPVFLNETPAGYTLHISSVAFTSRSVAYVESGYDTACAKYDGPTPRCTYERVVSYDLRTGTLRAVAQDTSADFVLSSQGWLAFPTTLDAAGRRGLAVVDRRGYRVVDAVGDVDPASVRWSGATLRWTRDGAAQSVAVR
ncbi:MAG: hypothetical protein WC558_10690 [Patulibacter sp.]